MKIRQRHGIYSPSQFLPALTAFITTPILTRLFPPAEYGYWALAASVSAFLVALAVSGFGSAVIRFYPAYKAKSTLNVFFATLGVSIGTVITVVAGVSFLTLFLLKEYLPAALYHLLPLVIMIFIAQSIFTVFIAVMRAQGRSGSFTSFQLFINYGGLGVGLLLVVVLGFRVEGLLWGTFLALASDTAFPDFPGYQGGGHSPTSLSSSGCPSNMAVCMAIDSGKCGHVGIACIGSIHHQIIPAGARRRVILGVL